MNDDEGREATPCLLFYISGHVRNEIKCLKWEGTFAEAGAGAIRKVQTEFKRRLHEIKNMMHPDELLGLSYHTGFQCS